MALSDKEIKDLAILARVGLSDSELSGMRRDLSGVLDFFRALEEYSVSEGGALPPAAANRARSDLTAACPPEIRQALKKNFPESRENFLKVRSVF